MAKKNSKIEEAIENLLIRTLEEDTPAEELAVIERKVGMARKLASEDDDK